MVAGADEERAAQASGLGGRATLAEGERLTVRGAGRELPIVLTLERAAGFDESAIQVGGRALDELLVPRLADGNAAWPAGEDGQPLVSDVHIEHQSGTWYRVHLGEAGAAGRTIEGLIAFYPPAPAEAELQWSAGPELAVDYVPGRLDVLSVRGQTPCEFQLEVTPRQKLGLAIAIDGKVVPASEVRRRDFSLCAPDKLVLYVPDWIAGVTDVLAGQGPAAPHEFRIERRSSGMPSEDRTPADQDLLSFIKRLRGDE